jgi:simple sugar transport system substrate-binding protein
MIKMASRMGTDQYIQFVGSLTNASHNEWMDCAKACADKNLPNLEFVAKYRSRKTRKSPTTR